MLRRLDPRVSSALSRELNDLVADCCELVRSCLASVYFNLREISLAFVLVFFGYCYSQDRATRSWAETSRIGFKEQGFCESGGRTYGVIDESILVDGVMLYRGPLVLDLSGASGASTCFSQQGRQLCGNSFGYAGGPFKELTVESLTKQFNQVVSKPVLNNSPWILATSVVNLCVNLLLKSHNLFDDRSGQQRVVFERFANFTTFLLVALLVSSSEQFKLIQNIDCRSNYAPGYSEPIDFCGLLDDCGAVLSRVITPSLSIVRRYREISLFSGIFVASAAFLSRSSTFPRVFHQRRDRNHRTAVRVAAITTAVDDDIESRIPFHESLNKIVSRNKMVSKWRIVPATYVDKDSDRLCSICLEQLLDDKQVVVSLPCEHCYHKNCILGWVTTGQMHTCPECRSPLE